MGLLTWVRSTHISRYLQAQTLSDLKSFTIIHFLKSTCKETREDLPYLFRVIIYSPCRLLKPSLFLSTCTLSTVATQYFSQGIFTCENSEGLTRWTVGFFYVILFCFSLWEFVDTNSRQRGFCYYFCCSSTDKLVSGSRAPLRKSVVHTAHNKPSPVLKELKLQFLYRLNWTLSSSP